MVEAIKWVDEVVTGSPYITTLEILDQHGCSFCCHGDDVTLTDEGVDTYQRIKSAGRYKEVQRTAGISTTGLVDRILTLEEQRDWTKSAFLLTTEKIVQFSEGKPPKSGDVVVYVAGAFDLFHAGHLHFLEKARALGDYLIVGLYSDHVINQYKGNNYPIMTLHERLLSLLACKYVSEVVIGAPFTVTKELMDNFKIDTVVGGCFRFEKNTILGDPYKYPKELNKFATVNSHSDVTTGSIIERIVKNKLEYKARNEKKEKKELQLINEIEKQARWDQPD
ncbi:CTP transf 2 domain containing protein [Asbolus verrucosus]|uniref:ethanolamine-phosphate cytidylyltransferase n=1 Tax=Asbolus verrucosus TaxID=1661398 RepID=A0A482WCD2_ASBVE|nr:CTP transf 2 domain containing protein [Asbolus verrucosus]